MRKLVFMNNPIGDALMAFWRGLASLIPTSVTEAVEGVVDFAYVKVLGLPFIVLGYRQTGKTTLLRWLNEQNLEALAGFEPDPTAAGGEAVMPFRSRFDGEGFRLRPRRDVGGEYAMWETDWVDLLREARPLGIIFMIDHEHSYHHKDALNFLLQMIDEDVVATSRLKHIMILVNKADLWQDDRSLDDLLDDFRNETRRLRSQSERVGYSYEIRATSLETGEGIHDAMEDFFNTIRPKSRVS